MAGITPKQQRFVEEYLIDLNATQAYIRAGYSATGARHNAARLITNDNVALAIEEAQDKRAERTGITQDWVLESIYETVERCKQAVPVTYKNGDPVMTSTPDGDIALAYSFDSGAVLKGAELAGKHLGMFVERSKVEVDHNYVARMPEQATTPEAWQEQHAPKTIQ